MDYKAIHELSRLLGFDPQKLYDWRTAFDNHRSLAGRPRGKIKRPRGMLSVADCFKEYGIKAKVLRKWRGMGMPTQQHSSSIMVSRKVLGEWMAKYLEDWE